MAPPQIKREPGTCVFGHPLPHLMNACPGVVGQTGGGDPAGSDTGVADGDRGSSSGTNLRPGGEPSPSRQGRAGSRFYDLTAREYRMDQLTADLADMVLEGEPRPVVDDWVEIVQPVIGPLSQRAPHHRDRLRAQVFGVASDGTLRLGFPPAGQLVHVFVRDEMPSPEER